MTPSPADPRQPGASEADINVTLRRHRGDDVLVQFREPAVLHQGERIVIPPGGLSVGRETENDIVLSSGLVSPRHATIAADGGRFCLTDLDSRTGTYLNGDHFQGTWREVQAGDTIAIGDEILYFVTTRDTPLPPIELPTASSLRMDRARLTLGREATNDIVLDHPTVSLVHAEIVATDRGARLRDVSSTSGTRLNGQLISKAFLSTGDEIGIGPFRFVFDGSLLVQRDTTQGLRLDAEGVSVVAGDKTILQPTWLSVQPGEFVALIGESGAGKTTLMRALAGVRRPNTGRVTVSGEDVSQRQTDIGYVPQDEIVHGRLTAREALRFAAELRLPEDMPSADLDAAVERVIGEVGLERQADTSIGSLSGGQRKRAGVASELISRPGLLFLDEPTTGLDPGLERRMMELLRGLADRGRAVILSTHATKSLRLCDKIAVMGRGGLLVFYGSPSDALEFFGAEDPDDVYTALEARPSEHWHQAFMNSEHGRRAWQGRSLPAPRSLARQAVRRVGPQTATLARRYALLFFRDRRNLAIIGAQTVLLALATAVLFKSGVFNRLPAGGVAPRNYMHAGESAQLIFLMLTIAIWFGAISSAREIIKERTVFAREFSVGVRLSSYLGSKALVLLPLATLQTLLLAWIVFQLRPLNQSGAGLPVLSILIATSWTAVSLGLVVSACARSEDQASSFIPLILIPQLLFGGAIVSTQQMGSAIRVLSGLVFAQWSFAGSGTAIDLKQRIASDPIFSRASKYGKDFFGLSVIPTLVILGLFILAFGGVTARILQRSGEAGRN